VLWHCSSPRQTATEASGTRSRRDIPSRKSGGGKDGQIHTRK